MDEIAFVSEVQDATTSPLPSPKKARKEIETQTSIPQVTSNQHPTALTVAEIKRRAGTDVGTDHPSNRAAIPPEIFLNLHFPHVQKVFLYSKDCLIGSVLL